jgi:hypothetical protein
VEERDNESDRGKERGGGWRGGERGGREREECKTKHRHIGAFHPPVTVRRYLAEAHVNMPPKTMYAAAKPSATKLLATHARTHIHTYTHVRTCKTKHGERHEY